MLVLTRKRGDPGIRIGENIWVRLDSLSRHGARISIEAPAGVVVSRGANQINSWPIVMRWSEVLQIGEDIRVKMVEIDRGKIRLGIEAPYYVNIVRGELIDMPRKETTQPAE